MGFPVGYTEVFLPKLFVQTLSVLGFIKTILSYLFRYMGQSDFIEMDQSWPDYPTRLADSGPPISAVLIRQILPVIRFEELISQDVGVVALVDPPECCAVCLYEFEGKEEIRWLKNCKHIFHRKCLDRWMDHDQKTCPLCRKPLVPDELQGEFNQRLWAASELLPDYYNDYSLVDPEL